MGAKFSRSPTVPPQQSKYEKTAHVAHDNDEEEMKDFEGKKSSMQGRCDNIRNFTLLTNYNLIFDDYLS